jgi:hypothetical protein
VAAPQRGGRIRTDQRRHRCLHRPLKEQGYLTGILGKVEHLEPVERFGWDRAIWMGELDMGGDPDAYRHGVRDSSHAPAAIADPGS